MFSAGRRPDLEALDHEPWVEAAQPIDCLIGLQQQAFLADRRGDHQRFGTALMAMSQIESSIDNHGEAAAYADNAAEAFERANNPAEAAAAHATVAREYRTLYSPDMALASLQDVIALNIGRPNRHITEEKTNMLTGEALPTLRLLANFASTFAGVEYYDPLSRHKGSFDYAPVILPKYPKPSRDASQEFTDSVYRLLHLPAVLSGTDALNALQYMSIIHKRISERQFGLRGLERRQARLLAAATAQLNSRLREFPDSSTAAELLNGTRTLYDMLPRLDSSITIKTSPVKLSGKKIGNKIEVKPTWIFH